MPTCSKGKPGLVLSESGPSRRNRARWVGPGLLFMIIVMSCGAALGSNDDGGLTAGQLRRLVQAVPDLGRIYAVKLLRDASVGGATSIAVLSARAGRGWSVDVIAKGKGGGFRVEWSSGELGEGFAVSSQSGLSLFDLGSEQAVTFGGCAAHMCPEVFSEMLYVPSKRQAFTGTCTDGKVRYSFKADEATLAYKSALDELLKQHPAMFAKPDWDAVCAGSDNALRDGER